MSYSKSSHRIDFESRIQNLLSESRSAQRLKPELRGLRDMTFQCAVFQTSAALETYLRLSIETWFQNLKVNNLGRMIPHAARARYFAKTLGGTFEAYTLSGDEAKIFKSLESKDILWDFMKGTDSIPIYINGSYLHENTAYPSNKNLRKLF